MYVQAQQQMQAAQDKIQAAVKDFQADCDKDFQTQDVGRMGSSHV
jgi:hypothetical protein